MSKKLILISTSSLLAVSPLIATISCNKSEEDVNAKLQAAKDAFTLTPIAEKPITNVQASTINDAAKLKEYFTETPGADFGTDKGFTYTYKSSTANTANSTQLDVVYEISYKGATVQWTKTIEGFSSSSNDGASQQQ